MGLATTTHTYARVTETEKTQLAPPMYLGPLIPVSTDICHAYGGRIGCWCLLRV